MVFDILGKAFALVDTLLEFGMGDISGNDDGSRQRKAGSDRVAG